MTETERIEAALNVMPSKERLWSPLNPTEQPCSTCKWAAFEMTKHNPPRINSKHYGQCNWPVPVVVPVAAA